MRRFIPRNMQQTEFERPEGMPQALHRLLMARGIGSAEEARAFLRPDASMMHDPAKLRGIPEAAELIRNAVMQQKKSAYMAIMTWTASVLLPFCISPCAAWGRIQRCICPPATMKVMA